MPWWHFKLAAAVATGAVGCTIAGARDAKPEAQALKVYELFCLFQFPSGDYWQGSVSNTLYVPPPLYPHDSEGSTVEIRSSRRRGMTSQEFIRAPWEKVPR